MYYFIVITWMFSYSCSDDQNIIPDDRLASGSLHSLGVANMSNYVEISSW